MQELPRAPVRRNGFRDSVAVACRECGYALTGLARSGTCPECGTSFPPLSQAKRRRWTAPRMCLALAWPLAGAVAGLLPERAAAWSPLVPLRSTGLAAFALMCLAMLVNTPVQIARPLLEHALPGRTVGNPLGHMSGGQAVAVTLAALLPVLFLLTVVLGLLLRLW